MRCLLLAIALLFTNFFLPNFVLAQFEESNKYIHPQIITEANSFQPGENRLIGVLFKIEPGWHIYWKKSGDAGLPTKIKWTLPEGWKIDELKWPAPLKIIEKGALTTFGYQNEVLLFTTITSPLEVPQANSEIKIKATVSWLACKDLCIPGKRDLELSLPYSTTGALEPTKEQPLFQKYSALIPSLEVENSLNFEVVSHDKPASADITSPSSKSVIPNAPFTLAQLAVALIFAFFAGSILNLMPCVIPVLSIKALQLAKKSDSSHKEIRHSIFAFCGGILATFFALSLVTVLLKYLGRSAGWGFQFQYPGYVFILLIIIFFSALSCFDLFTIRIPGMNHFSAQSKNPLLADFKDGVVITLLSAPCSAPLLAPALAFAFSTPTYIIPITFLFVGIGFSFPYLIVAGRPKMLSLIPKPGTWTVHLKEFVGFTMFGVALWLLYVLNSLVPGSLFSTLLFLFLGSFLLWIPKLFQDFAFRSSTRFLFDAFILLAFLSGAWGTFCNLGAVAKSEAFLTYSPTALAKTLENKHGALIIFGAEWCITCKFNERLVLKSNEVIQTAKENNIDIFKADWTTGDPIVTEALQKYNGSAVPYYVFFSKGSSEPEILPTLLTTSTLVGKFTSKGR
jgi:thiol:disulfide interchange protein